MAHRSQPFCPPLCRKVRRANPCIQQPADDEAGHESRRLQESDYRVQTTRKRFHAKALQHRPWPFALARARYCCLDRWPEAKAMSGRSAAPAPLGVQWGSPGPRNNRAYSRDGSPGRPRPGSRIRTKQRTLKRIKKGEEVHTLSIPCGMEKWRKSTRFYTVSPLPTHCCHIGSSTDTVRFNAGLPAVRRPRTVCAVLHSALPPDGCLPGQRKEPAPWHASR